MIIGIGIDMIELSRIKSLVCRKPRFIKKILTPEEETLFHLRKTANLQIEFLAGRFAAKEAFSKAYGTGIGKISFHDMTILTGLDGEPKFIFNREHLFKIHVSISHSRTSAIAQVILEQ